MVKQFEISSLAVLLLLVSACSGDAVPIEIATPDADSNTTNNDDNSGTTGSSDNNSNNSNTDNGNTNSTDSTSSAECTLSPVQQQLLDAHNVARSQARACGTTNFPATTPLDWDCTLASIAQDHNVDMGTHNFFSHTGSDGLSSANRATNAGYVWRTVGENIAAGYGSVAAVVQGWIDSPGHCENLMNPAYEEVGADLYEVSGSDFPTYWTVNFGTER